MTTQPPIDHARAIALLSELRETRPLVHNITNYVAMTLSANVLLALGASPAMVHAIEEVEAFVSISSSLVINIGTLSAPWVEAMRLAARRAGALRKPWVLDPVGCGATPYRTQVAAELAALGPSIIRGNASEILSLAAAVGMGGAGGASGADGASGAGAGGSGKGVDSTDDSSTAITAAANLAKRTGAVVAVTGAVDYATDGERVISVASGDVLMTLSTGLGCALSATTAAFAAVATPLEAASTALLVYGAAGKLASQACRGPGQLPAALCDALYTLDATLLTEYATLSSHTL